MLFAVGQVLAAPIPVPSPFPKPAPVAVTPPTPPPVPVSSCLPVGGVIPIAWGSTNAGTAALISGILLNMDDDSWTSRQAATNQLNAIIDDVYFRDTAQGYEIFRSVLAAADWLTNCLRINPLEIRDRLRKIEAAFDNEFYLATDNPLNRTFLCAELKSLESPLSPIHAWELRQKGIENARIESQLHGCTPITILPSEVFTQPGETKEIEDGGTDHRATHSVYCTIEEYCPQ